MGPAFCIPGTNGAKYGAKWVFVESGGLKWSMVVRSGERPKGGAMSKFVGRYQHSLDDKGRLILPAKFRFGFERGGNLSPQIDGCIGLWDQGGFQRQVSQRESVVNEGDKAARNKARYWASLSREIEFDKQGRFVLPIDIREYAGISSEVIIVGALDHIELWDPTVFAEVVDGASEAFKAGQ